MVAGIGGGEVVESGQCNVSLKTTFKWHSNELIALSSVTMTGVD